MVLPDGGIKVMDFGVARLDSSTLTALGTVVGSVRYMSPEQMMGERVDGRADIFSLAAVAYELLTGRAPFPGRTVTEVVSRVVRGAHVPPAEVDARLPGALNEVFAQALSPAPDRRPRHAVDFAKALAEAARPAFALEVRRDPPPAANPGAPAVLLLESDPEGAEVVIDGEPRGRTPLSVEVAPGRHELELRAPGRETVSSVVEATRGEALQVFSASLPWPRPAAAEAAPLEAGGVGMTPPRRVAGGPPAYPEWARLAGLEGLVALEVEIDEEGAVRGVRLRQSAGERLDQLMLEAVAGWRFAPALRDGRPAAVRFVARHAFRR
jgi:TonB family protein